MTKAQDKREDRQDNRDDRDRRGWTPVAEAKAVAAAWDEVEQEAFFARNAEAVVAADREAMIVMGFVTVFNRRRRERLQGKNYRDRVLLSRAREQYEADLAVAGRVGPTPETRRKLKTDVVLRMLQQGRLTRAEEKAAGEIREAREAIMRALFPSRTMEPLAAKTKGVWRGRAGLERLTEREQALWRRYIHWARGLGDHPFAGVDTTRLQVVLYVIEDNMGPRQVARFLRVRDSAVMPILKRALGDYATMAGFRGAPRPA